MNHPVLWSTSSPRPNAPLRPPRNPRDSPNFGDKHRCRGECHGTAGRSPRCYCGAHRHHSTIGCKTDVTLRSIPRTMTMCRMVSWKYAALLVSERRRWHILLGPYFTNIYTRDLPTNDFSTITNVTFASARVAMTLA